MYDARFFDAINYNGKPYRDKNTGNLIEHCLHVYVAHPRFGEETDFHAEILPLERKTFEGLRLVCSRCGDMTLVSAENFVKDEEELNKKLEEYLKEMEEEKTN